MGILCAYSAPFNRILRLFADMQCSNAYVEVLYAALKIAGGGKPSFEQNSELTTADLRIAAVGGAAPH